MQAKVARALKHLCGLRSVSASWFAEEEWCFQQLLALDTVEVDTSDVAGDRLLVFDAVASGSQRVFLEVLRVCFPELVEESTGCVAVAQGSPGLLSLHDAEGNTPLFWAAKWGCPSLFAFLFEDLTTRAGGLDAGLDLCATHAAKFHLQDLLFWALGSAPEVFDIRQGRERVAVFLISKTHVVVTPACLLAACSTGSPGVMDAMMNAAGPGKWKDAVAGCCARDLGAAHSDCLLVRSCVSGSIPLVQWFLGRVDWDQGCVVAAVGAVAGDPGLGTLHVSVACTLLGLLLPRVLAPGPVVKHAFLDMLAWKLQDTGMRFPKSLAHDFASLLFKDASFSVDELTCALQSDVVETVQFVISRTSPRDLALAFIDDTVVSPLVHACRFCSVEVVELLLEYAPVEVMHAPSKVDGLTPIEVAASAGNVRVVDFLLGMGLHPGKAFVMLRDTWDMEVHTYPLGVALVKECPAVAKGLVTEAHCSPLLPCVPVVGDPCTCLEAMVVMNRFDVWNTAFNAIVNSARRKKTMELVGQLQLALHGTITRCCLYGYSSFLQRVLLRLQDVGRLGSLPRLREMGMPLGALTTSASQQCLDVLLDFGWTSPGPLTVPLHVVRHNSAVTVASVPKGLLGLGSASGPVWSWPPISFFMVLTSDLYLRYTCDPVLGSMPGLVHLLSALRDVVVHVSCAPWRLTLSFGSVSDSIPEAWCAALNTQWAGGCVGRDLLTVLCAAEAWKRYLPYVHVPYSALLSAFASVPARVAKALEVFVPEEDAVDEDGSRHRLSVCSLVCARKHVSGAQGALWARSLQGLLRSLWSWDWDNKAHVLRVVYVSRAGSKLDIEDDLHGFRLVQHAELMRAEPGAARRRVVQRRVTAIAEMRGVLRQEGRGKVAANGDPVLVIVCSPSLREVVQAIAEDVLRLAGVDVALACTGLL